MSGLPRLGRAPWTTAGDLDEAQRQLRDQISASWGGGAVGLSPVDPAGRLVGPFDLMAVSPEVGGAMLSVATSFRDAELSAAERELVILVVAVAEQSEFMWEGHLPVAVAAGLGDEIGEMLKQRVTPPLDEPLRTVHHVARALTDERDLDQATFDLALERLGWRRVQEIVWLTGLYQALGLAMRVARTPLPAQEER